VTDSGVLCPFPEGVGCGRVPRPPRALGCFGTELRLRVADPPRDERPVDPPFDGRLVERGLDDPPARAPDPPLDERWLERLFDVPVVERALEELDEPPRREDVFGWAIGLPPIVRIRSSPRYRGGIGAVPRAPACRNVFICGYAAVSRTPRCTPPPRRPRREACLLDHALLPRSGTAICAFAQSPRLGRRRPRRDARTP
jgi:hypothetical protein